MSRTLSGETRANLATLRAFCRYQTHGGYVWGAVLSDGALLCETCALENYRKVFTSTRDNLDDGWQVVGLMHSGEHEDDTVELCANCNKVLFGNLTMSDRNAERFAELIPEWRSLIAALIPEIADDYRATDDPEDTEPGMQVTVASDAELSSWGYQTGDNSYTGGAYSFPHWAVVYLSRESDPQEVAEDIAGQLADLIYS